MTINYGKLDRKEGADKMKTSGKVMIIALAIIWGFCIVSMGPVFGSFFAVLGTILVLAINAGVVKSKGDMYLSQKYDEGKKQ